MKLRIFLCPLKKRHRIYLTFNLNQGNKCTTLIEVYGVWPVERLLVEAALVEARSIKRKI
jgi:hypothetical protein